eukprot:gene17231-19750_t
MFTSRLAFRTAVRHSTFASSKRMASGSTYNVTLNIDTATLKQLRDQGYTLYAFKGIKPSSKATLSTVWFALQDYMEETTITWTEEYQAYISLSKLDNGATINSFTKRMMSAGNYATVDSTGEGILTISTDSSSGTSNEIEAVSYNFYNPSKTIYACGLSHKNPDGTVKPICATPLNPGNAVPIVPIQKVFFFFSTGQLNLGQAFTQATSDGFLLDLTMTPNMTISYNTQDTWGAGGNPAASKQTAQPFFDLWGR